MHEYGPVFLLFLGIFAGIWLNRRDYTALKGDLNELKADTNRQFDGVNRRLDRIDVRLDKMDESIAKFTKLEGRVEELSRR